MEQITGLINCILITVTIVGIIEIILPEGETRKFAILVLGLITSVTIATPFIAWFSDEISFEEVFDISKVEDNYFYMDTLRSTSEKQTVMLEEIFSRNVTDTFNRQYKDMEIDSCVIRFERLQDGKIGEIEGVYVSISKKIDDLSELKRRISALCEIDTGKVSVSVI